MNKARRAALEKVKTAIEDAKVELEALHGEERDYFDNMPESFQGGDKGQEAEQAADALQSALDSLEEAVASIDEATGG